MKIKILEVKTSEPYRNGNKSNHYGRPAVYFFLKGESILMNLLERKNRPYNEFKKVLDEALQMAGLKIKATDLGWSQYAGCTCPCSPGFIPTKFTPLSQNVYVYYTIEEGETPDTPKTYSSIRLEHASSYYATYPDNKDYERARGLKNESDASKMAKLITDPEKLVRRLKAVLKMSPYEYRKPFLTRMKEMGFTSEQMNKVLGVKPRVAVILAN